MARKTKDHDGVIKVLNLIADDARRERDDPDQTTAERERRGEVWQGLFAGIEAHNAAAMAARVRVHELTEKAFALFGELEKISPEIAVNVFRRASSKKARGKAYDPRIEAMLLFHASMTDSTYKTAEFAHRLGIGTGTVAALQKHIQRLESQFGDKRPMGKSRDK
jgi:hypothetical protein